MNQNTPKKARAVYIISVAAELCGTHPQTLRIWERHGLLSPARTAGGSRRYSDHDLAIAQRVVELGAQGVSLAGIAQILRLEAENEVLRKKVSLLRERLETQNQTGTR